MAKYASTELGVSFSLPDSLTVAQQLRWSERLFESKGDGIYQPLWRAAVPLLEEWECDIIPDPDKLDLDNETRRVVTSIVRLNSNLYCRSASA